jgi:nicotinate-nucleotide adenylyltransferase
LKQTLRKADQLFFVMGIDAFLDIGKWYEAAALLRECEFVVASRPGYSLADVANALPEKIRPASHVTKPFQKQAAVGDLVLPGATIRLLDSVQQKVSSSAIREAVASGKALGKLVNPAVAEYIRKMGLYGKR